MTHRKGAADASLSHDGGDAVISSAMAAPTDTRTPCPPRVARLDPAAREQLRGMARQLRSLPPVSPGFDRLCHDLARVLEHVVALDRLEMLDEDQLLFLAACYPALGGAPAPLGLPQLQPGSMGTEHEDCFREQIPQL